MKDAKKAKAYRLRLYRELIDDPNHPRHGTLTGYQCGCRCDACRERGREYHHDYYEAKREIRRHIREEYATDADDDTRQAAALSEAVARVQATVETADVRSVDADADTMLLGAKLVSAVNSNPARVSMTRPIDVTDHPRLWHECVRDLKDIDTSGNAYHIAGRSRS